MTGWDMISAMKIDSNDPVLKLALRLAKKAREALSANPALTPENIHDLRVLTKKLRALLRLYYPTIRHKQRQPLRRLDQAIKSLADELAESRDASVLYTTLDDVIRKHSSELSPAQQYLLDQYKPVNVAPEPIPAASIDAKLGSIVESWQSVSGFLHGINIKQGIDFSYLRAQKLAKNIRRSHDDDQFHQYRKWLKYHLYQIELVATKPGKAISNYTRHLDKLGKQLGVLHDVYLLQESLLRPQRFNRKPVAPAQCIDEVLGLIELRKDELQTQCRKKSTGLFAQKHCPVKIRLA